jgi:O-antigen/teichoic acid export membrane protein
VTNANAARAPHAGWEGIRLARDTAYSVTFHIAPRLANVVLFVLIGRWAGSAEAGIFALAASFLLISTTTMRGLDDLLVREVSRQPGQAGRLLLGFAELRLGLSVLVYGLVMLAVRAGFGYPEATARPVLLLSLSVIPDGVSHVAQAVLMGQRRYDAPALVLAIVSGLKVAGGAGAVLRGGGLEAVSLAWLTASGLGALVILGLAVRVVGGLTRADWLDWRPLRANLRPAVSFVLITLLLAFESQTDTLVLSKVRSEAEIGWYGAATTVAFGLLTFSQAYRFSAYPVMARYAQLAPEKLADFYRQSLRLIALVALPVSVGLMITAPQVISLIFGSGFEPAVRPLQILCLGFIFMFLNEPNSRMMLVGDRQRAAVMLLASTTITNIILNLILTPRFGETGAALARLGSVLLLFGSYTAYVSMNLVYVDMLRVLARPIVATLLMAVFVWSLRDQTLPVMVSAGALAYAALAFILYPSLRSQFLRLSRIVIRPGNSK